MTPQEVASVSCPFQRMLRPKVPGLAQGYLAGRWWPSSKQRESHRTGYNSDDLLATLSTPLCSPFFEVVVRTQ